MLIELTLIELDLTIFFHWKIRFEHEINYNLTKWNDSIWKKKMPLVHGNRLKWLN